jgi:hypothetical protein
MKRVYCTFLPAVCIILHLISVLAFGDLPKIYPSGSPLDLPCMGEFGFRARNTFAHALLAVVSSWEICYRYAENCWRT